MVIKIEVALLVITWLTVMMTVVVIKIMSVFVVGIIGDTVVLIVEVFPSLLFLFKPLTNFLLSISVE